jgi:hypothetical protein
VALAERPELMVFGEWLEHPEGIQGAGDRSRLEFTAASLAGAPEHREVEARVVSDEHPAPKEFQ